MSRTRVLVTGGPTRAYLDDIRFLTNYSTGELAKEICASLSGRRCLVSAIFGPTAFELDSVRAKRKKRIETNAEMRKAVLAECRSFKPHYVIFAAAVLDFVPLEKKRGKTASSGPWTILLVPTPKIIEDVKIRFPKIRRIGFKLESKKLKGAQLEKFALRKMREQDLHALCLNFFSDVSGTSHRARVFSPTGHSRVAVGKKKIAQLIVDTIDL